MRKKRSAGFARLVIALQVVIAVGQREDRTPDAPRAITLHDAGNHACDILWVLSRGEAERTNDRAVDRAERSRAALKGNERGVQIPGRLNGGDALEIGF